MTWFDWLKLAVALVCLLQAGILTTKHGNEKAVCAAVIGTMLMCGFLDRLFGV